MTTTPQSTTEPAFQDDGLEADETDLEVERARRRKRSLIVAVAVVVGFAALWVLATTTTGTVSSISKIGRAHV